MQSVTFDDAIVGCARIVERGDPDRFAAAMAAPREARAVLFAVYAFNVEVARAPWVTQEPMIAQMRLQWWDDVLTEIGAGGPVRRHEVATPLAEAIGAAEAAMLHRVVSARRADPERAPFADARALLAYLGDTAGGLAAAAAMALGATMAAQDEDLRAWGQAAGLARYLQAVPALEARGKLPLPDGRAEAVAALASERLAALDPSLRDLRRRLGPMAGAAVLEFWQAPALLRMAAQDPAAVAEGRLALSPFRRRAGLIAAAW